MGIGESHLGPPGGSQRLSPKWPERGRILPTRVGVFGSAEHAAVLPSPDALGARSLRGVMRSFRCSRGGGVSKALQRIPQGRSRLATPLQLKRFTWFGFCPDEKIWNKTKPPSANDHFTSRAPWPAPRCGRGSGPGREERGASANCSFVRFRVWEAAVRALISAAHYPG